jgi:hypothetical protein
LAEDRHCSLRRLRQAGEEAQQGKPVTLVLAQNEIDPANFEDQIGRTQSGEGAAKLGNLCEVCDSVRILIGIERKGINGCAEGAGERPVLCDYMSDVP